MNKNLSWENNGRLIENKELAMIEHFHFLGEVLEDAEHYECEDIVFSESEITFGDIFEKAVYDTRFKFNALRAEQLLGLKYS